MFKFIGVLVVGIFLSGLSCFPFIGVFILAGILWAWTNFGFAGFIFSGILSLIITGISIVYIPVLLPLLVLGLLILGWGFN
jgi:hypothetical protein